MQMHIATRIFVESLRSLCTDGWSWSTFLRIDLFHTNYWDIESNWTCQIFLENRSVFLALAGARFCEAKQKSLIYFFFAYFKLNMKKIKIKMLVQCMVLQLSVYLTTG